MNTFSNTAQRRSVMVLWVRQQSRSVGQRTHIGMHAHRHHIHAHAHTGACTQIHTPYRYAYSHTEKHTCVHTGTRTHTQNIHMHRVMHYTHRHTSHTQHQHTCTHGNAAHTTLQVSFIQLTFLGHIRSTSRAPKNYKTYPIEISSVPPSSQEAATCPCSLSTADYSFAKPQHLEVFAALIPWVLMPSCAALGTQKPPAPLSHPLQ